MTGLLAGVIPVTVGYFMARVLNRRLALPVRYPIDVDPEPAVGSGNWKPGLGIALMPIALPVAFISRATVAKAVDMWQKTEDEFPPSYSIRTGLPMPPAFRDF